MKAALYNQKGDLKGEVNLSKDIFGVEGADSLVHSYLVYQQANARNPIAHVMNKGDVRGGGKKPFAQKHTGRARQGSTRNPHMRGGGNAFGPKKWQNFELMMPKKMRRKALFTLLSEKAKNEKIMVVDEFNAEAPKTKMFFDMVSKMPIGQDVLVVRTRDEKTLLMSARNVENAKTILFNYINPADLLKYESVLFTEAALKEFETQYTK